MQKKSALTAALSGAPAAAASATIPGSTLDPAVFPCIPYADVVDGKVGPADVVADELAGLDLSRIAIVGSAPTNVFLDGVPLVGPGGDRAAVPPGVETPRAACACVCLGERRPLTLRRRMLHAGGLPAEPAQEERWTGGGP